MNRQRVAKTGQEDDDCWAEFVDSLVSFNPDILEGPAVALSVEASSASNDLPMHSHRRGQLVMPTRGTVRCDVADGFWVVPPRCAFWIPAGYPHRSQVSAKGRIIFLYVVADEIALPEECCTMSITPLVQELIRHLARQDQNYGKVSPTGRLVGVLLEQLATMQRTALRLPMPRNARLRKIAHKLYADPSNRWTIREWAASIAMSERSLARLIQLELGMSFGQWRQQIHIIFALEALSDGTAVQAVALRLGYESVSAFITMFKKAMGHSPGHYLRKRG